MNKNLIVNFISDYSGHGHIRNIRPFGVINTIYASQQKIINVHSHYFTKDENILNNARALYFQRQMMPEQFRDIQFYSQIKEQLGYRMVWDIDDMIWGKNEQQGGTKEEGIPTYNFSWKNVADSAKIFSVEIMKLMDTCTFATQFLANYCKEKFGLTNKLVVMPNSVPRYMWYTEKPEKTDDIKKPKVLYTGSPTHYSNQDKLLGDWDNSWKDWVIKSVNNDEIEFVVIGGLPFFFEEIKEKITVFPWIQEFDFPNTIKAIKADFQINPLVPNDFNSAKSDLKFIEAAATKSICIGTVFDKSGRVSPYDNIPVKASETITVEEIDELFKKYTNKEVYNETISKQNKIMEETGRWTESPIFVNHLMKTVLGT